MSWFRRLWDMLTGRGDLETPPMTVQPQIKQESAPYMPMDSIAPPPPPPTSDGRYLPLPDHLAQPTDELGAAMPAAPVKPKSKAREKARDKKTTTAAKSKRSTNKKSGDRVSIATSKGIKVVKRSSL